MATRETAASRGRRRGVEIMRSLLAELRNARVNSDVSGRALARTLGWSESQYRRFESGEVPPTIADLSGAAAVLGLDLAASLHPAGEPIRDKGHQALLARALALISPAWRVSREVPFANLGDPRTWDAGLRNSEQSIGLEAETRIRDIQAVVRKIHQRERDGGMDEIVLVLARTAHNRRLLAQLLLALGPRFHTQPRLITKALRDGRPVPGSGVILL